MTHRISNALLAMTLLCMAGGCPALAESLKDKVIGAWTLEAGSENFPDGKKLEPWATGNLILDTSGHLSFFLIGKDQPKTGPSVRTPLGPLVAYYGTYTIDEPNATLTYKIEYGASPLFNGATRTQKITFNGDTMVTTGSEVQTPEGKMIPVNQWKRAK